MTTGTRPLPEGHVVRVHLRRMSPCLPVPPRRQGRHPALDPCRPLLRLRQRRRHAVHHRRMCPEVAFAPRLPMRPRRHLQPQHLRIGEGGPACTLRAAATVVIARIVEDSREMEQQGISKVGRKMSGICHVGGGATSGGPRPLDYCIFTAAESPVARPSTRPHWEGEPWPATFDFRTSAR